MRDPDDHYAALDVDPAATREEIREAWRFHLTAFHPDRFRDPAQRARAEEITKAANAAWQVLGDASGRRRYDLRRDRDGRGATPPAPQAPPPPPVRELPCPSCATRSRVPDAGGRVVRMACPACREEFSAMIGARCVGRPILEKRWLGLRYSALFADHDGTRTSVSFRHLPKELALHRGRRGGDGPAPVPAAPVVPPAPLGIAEDLPRGVGALGDLLGAAPLAGVAEPVRVEGDQQEAPRGVDLLRGGLRGDFQRPVVVVAVAHPCRTA